LIRTVLTLTVVLCLFWITMSGYFKPLLLSLGVISVGLVLGLCWRMKILDREGVPYLGLPKILSYLVWLMEEIVKSNVAVVKAVLSPDLEISPTLVKVPMQQKSDFGRTVFANSITLTPGTVSIDLDGYHILVHALLAEMTDLAGFIDMGDRAAWASGELPDAYPSPSASPSALKG